LPDAPPRVRNYGGGPILVTRSHPDQPHLDIAHNGRPCATLRDMGDGRWRLLLGQPAGTGFIAQTIRWVHGSEEDALAEAAPWIVLASRRSL
jgi:hypothetical protein